MQFNCKNDKDECISINLPKEIINQIFSYLADNNSYEQLIELVKCKRINKAFNQFANEIYKKKLAEQSEQIKILEIEDWQGQLDYRQKSNPPIENLFFATAIQHNLLFWMHNYLKNKSYLVDKLVYNNVYPLHIAALHDNTHSAKFLLALDADLDKLDTSYASTPIVYAIESCHNKTAKILMDAEFYKQAKTNFKLSKWVHLKEIASHFNEQIMPEIDQIIDIINK